MDEAQAAAFQSAFRSVAANVKTVIEGKDDVIVLALICLFADGHLLIEDVPGTGKTSLAKAMSRSVDGTWSRIQFTPDLLPSDVTGVSIWNQGTREFEFKPGPIFANIVVADEINRASPKTQSALLEVMEENRVTVDTVSHPVTPPFMVVATQNPVDMDGTYKLPEAQLDRFLMRITVGYPDHDAEVDILDSRQTGSPIDQVRPVVHTDQVRAMIRAAAGVHASRAVKGYIVRLCQATRDAPGVRLGASPRAGVALLHAACVLAASEARLFVTPEDIKRLAPSVLGHRVLLTPEASLHGETVGALLQRILSETPVPARERVG